MAVNLPPDEMGIFSLSSFTDCIDSDVGSVIIEMLFEKCADDDTSASLELDSIIGLPFYCNLCFLQHNVLKDAWQIAKPSAASASAF